jgi:hypothetical protein
MGIGRDHLRPGSWDIWRRATGVVAIYALLLQGILLGFAGVATSLSPDQGYPAFDLCLTGHQDGPLAPADLPGHNGNAHCIFCFAGTHYASAPPPPLVSSRRFDLAIENVRWPLDDWRLPDFYEYSSALPRGPPRGA